MDFRSNTEKHKTNASGSKGNAATAQVEAWGIPEEETCENGNVNWATWPRDNGKSEKTKNRWIS